MVSEEDVAHIAVISDVGVDASELKLFTGQFNAIFEYFDILDSVEGGTGEPVGQTNIFREDVVVQSLSQEEVLRNSTDPEDGFIRAPRVI
ncbi:aspartyl-tRNA(Asn)/glutamyl-tRNA(Gln) amidotransferase subunit C [Methanocalculus alkaliphilus]|uniref:Asp-tRNA(Asn)/Glu-tRNA(Gln) amidotransferase subunit GatC n=1 Tax=Methanocalculus alkaliphilus TaxID=768730 RepID=UPI00209C7E35|nr:Asp-tRNA(Asn)/Glu-tRNA(Gln) amidotransferase subunit GatC [Methanocalculus alkaliphilus]MCP1714697.1 aspartyl-tRNA(Asn)/glutamyl-tRNA(Gln) amidotransferase subunit C [Methanocalculus alkaliphilus]